MGIALIPYEGEEQFMDYIGANYTLWYLALYQTAGPPSMADVLSDYTSDECDFGGYVRNTLAVSGGGTADPNNNLAQDWGSYTFTADGTISAPQTASGWFLFDSVTNKLIAACDLDVPVVFTTSGDFLTIDLTGFGGNLTPPL